MNKFVLSTFLILTGSAPCFAKCHVDLFRLYWGHDTTATQHVSVGGRCKLKFSMGAGSGIESLSITEQAAHGRASTNGSVAYPEVYYVPRPGYKGVDEYVFTMKGGQKNAFTESAGATKVRVSVEVR